MSETLIKYTHCIEWNSDKNKDTYWYLHNPFTFYMHKDNILLLLNANRSAVYNVCNFLSFYIQLLQASFAGFQHSIILKLSKKAIKYIKDKSLNATKWWAIKVEKRQFLKVYFCELVFKKCIVKMFWIANFWSEKLSDIEIDSCI